MSGCMQPQHAEQDDMILHCARLHALASHTVLFHLSGQLYYVQQLCSSVVWLYSIELCSLIIHCAAL